MIFIIYVCVASRWLSVRSIYSTGTIFFFFFFLTHRVEGRGRNCHVVSCRLSVRRALKRTYSLEVIIRLNARPNIVSLQ